MTRERSFRVYGEGPTPRCSSPLLEAWRRACLEEERAAAMGWPVRQVMAAVARVACEEALNSARRN